MVLISYAKSGSKKPKARNASYASMVQVTPSENNSKKVSSLDRISENSTVVKNYSVARDYNPTNFTVSAKEIVTPEQKSVADSSGWQTINAKRSRNISKLKNGDSSIQRSFTDKENASRYDIRTSPSEPKQTSEKNYAGCLSNKILRTCDANESKGRENDCKSSSVTEIIKSHYTSVPAKEIEVQSVKQTKPFSYRDVLLNSSKRRAFANRLGSVCQTKKTEGDRSNIEGNSTKSSKSDVENVVQNVSSADANIEMQCPPPWLPTAVFEPNSVHIESSRKTSSKCLAQTPTPTHVESPIVEDGENESADWDDIKPVVDSSLPSLSLPTQFNPDKSFNYFSITSEDDKKTLGCLISPSNCVAMPDVNSVRNVNQKNPIENNAPLPTRNGKISPLSSKFLFLPSTYENILANQNVNVKFGDISGVEDLITNSNSAENSESTILKESVDCTEFEITSPAISFGVSLESIIMEPKITDSPMKETLSSSLNNEHCKSSLSFEINTSESSFAKYNQTLSINENICNGSGELTDQNIEYCGEEIPVDHIVDCSTKLSESCFGIDFGQNSSSEFQLVENSSMVVHESVKNSCILEEKFPSEDSIHENHIEIINSGCPEIKDCSPDIVLSKCLTSSMIESDETNNLSPEEVGMPIEPIGMNISRPEATEIRININNFEPDCDASRSTITSPIPPPVFEVNVAPRLEVENVNASYDAIVVEADLEKSLVGSTCGEVQLVDSNIVTDSKFPVEEIHQYVSDEPDLIRAHCVERSDASELIHNFPAAVEAVTTIPMRTEPSGWTQIISEPVETCAHFETPKHLDNVNSDFSHSAAVENKPLSTDQISESYTNEQFNACKRDSDPSKDSVRPTTNDQLPSTETYVGYKPHPNPPSNVYNVPVRFPYVMDKRLTGSTAHEWQSANVDGFNGLQPIHRMQFPMSINNYNQNGVRQTLPYALPSSQISNVSRLPLYFVRPPGVFPGMVPLYGNYLPRNIDSNVGNYSQIANEHSYMSKQPSSKEKYPDVTSVPGHFEDVNHYRKDSLGIKRKDTQEQKRGSISQDNRYPSYAGQEFTPRLDNCNYDKNTEITSSQDMKEVQDSRIASEYDFPIEIASNEQEDSFLQPHEITGTDVFCNGGWSYYHRTLTAPFGLRIYKNTFIPLTEAGHRSSDDRARICWQGYSKACDLYTKNITEKNMMARMDVTIVCSKGSAVCCNSQILSVCSQFFFDRLTPMPYAATSEYLTVYVDLPVRIMKHFLQLMSVGEAFVPLHDVDEVIAKSPLYLNILL